MRTDWTNLQAPLQQALDTAIANGEEHSCQLAIYHHGKQVVSLCAGGVTPKSLFPVFSCSKSVVATVVARLVQKGILNYNMYIRDLWPEFACNGKEEMQLWHFMSHRAALATPPVDSVSEEMADWDRMCALMAAATPSEPIGGRQIYHGITYAWLAGEVIRRATGKPFPQVLHEEVLAPLGLDGDIVYGATDEAETRYVPVDATAFATGADWCSKTMNNPVLRRACIPSFTGLMTADALARHYAALIGEVNGVRLLKPEILEKATTLCRSPEDPIKSPSQWDKFGLGYALMGPPEEWGALFGQGGACGSEGMAFKHGQVAIAFTKNKSLPCHPQHKIRDTLSDILEIPHRLW